ncbi:DNA-binding NtrC family response regulator [Variovorax sp. GrIS 2.14]|uniref:helix-turn-helix domain-containing protein n=1 Tax=Variovorax sp. GrIS 2.14 TaxID=3071709 RepID=UPI0038F724EA
MRLTSGLSVWLQATWQGRDGIDFRHATPLRAARIADAGRAIQVIEVAETAASTTTPADTPDIPATVSPSEADTLRGHSRKLIEDALAAHGGNIAQAARQLKVSRGMLYRRLHRWSQTDGVVPTTNTSAG